MEFQGVSATFAAKLKRAYRNVPVPCFLKN